VFSLSPSFSVPAYHWYTFSALYLFYLSSVCRTFQYFLFLYIFHSFLFLTFTDSLRHFSISGNDAAVPNLSFACPPVHPCFLRPQLNASGFVFSTQIHTLHLNH
jgi:hypothetical protein